MFHMLLKKIEMPNSLMYLHVYITLSANLSQKKNLQTFTIQKDIMSRTHTHNRTNKMVKYYPNLSYLKE